MPFKLLRYIPFFAFMFLSHESVLAFSEKSPSSRLVDTSLAKDTRPEAANANVEVTLDVMHSPLFYDGGESIRVDHEKAFDSSQPNEFENRDHVNRHHKLSTTNEPSEGIIDELKRRNNADVNFISKPRQSSRRAGTILSRALKTAQMTAIFVLLASVYMLYCTWKYKDAPADDDQIGSFVPIRR